YRYGLSAIHARTSLPNWCSPAGDSAGRAKGVRTPFSGRSRIRLLGPALGGGRWLFRQRPTCTGRGEHGIQSGAGDRRAHGARHVATRGSWKPRSGRAGAALSAGFRTEESVSNTSHIANAG